MRPYPVAIGDHEYLVDTSLPTWSSWGYRREPQATVKDQQDRQDLISEQTTVREDFYRRAQETWEGGAGQSTLDRKGADPTRFRTSKGIYPWERWKLSLLPDTLQKRTTANTNLQILAVGSYLYLSDGNEVYWTQDVTVTTPTWTAANIRNADSASAVVSMSTDGFTVYVVLANGHLHTTTRGATTSTHYWTSPSGSATRVGYVKGRLLVASGFHLYNVLTGSTQNELTPTTFNTDWTWTSFGEGPSSIYAAGFSGDKSKVYRIALTPEGTQLGAPVLAGEVPDGEIVRALDAYLGTVLIGTDKGVRLALPDSGFLVVGPLVQTTKPVYCFEPQDQFVWFGFSNFDAVSTGLGRVDLRNFTLPLTPAYASDLMATGQGDVSGVVTFQGLRVFCVQALGVWAETTNLVAQGTLDSGVITHALPDPKTAIAADLRHQPLDGSVEMHVAADDGTFTVAHTSEAQGQSATGITNITPVQATDHLEARIVLNRSATDSTKGPKLLGWALMSYPIPRKSDTVTLPVILRSRVATADGQEAYFDTAKEFDYLKSLEKSGLPVDFREGDRIESAIVDEVTILAEDTNEDMTFIAGLCVVRLVLLPS